MRLLAVLIAPLVLGACAATDKAHSDARRAGEPPSSALYQTISARDAALSDAFNRHDVPALMALFDKDLEFFHDAGGLQRYADVHAGFTNLLGRDDGMRRDLVTGSLRVYPIKDYGAVEMGSHRFCHVESGKEVCGVFEFVQVWRQSEDHWKITRVVSYGH